MSLFFLVRVECYCGATCNGELAFSAPYAVSVPGGLSLDNASDSEIKLPEGWEWVSHDNFRCPEHTMRVR